MSVIYLRHPAHGEMAESNNAMVQVARENGWVEFDPTVPAEEAEPENKLPSFLGGGESDIPASFPARQVLIENGVTAWSELVKKSFDDLIALKGIGPATAKEILDKLNS